MWLRMQTGRASAGPTGRLVASAWALLAARSAVTTGAAPEQQAQAVAGRRGVQRTAAVQHTRRLAVQRRPPVERRTARRVAARTARGPLRSLVGVRNLAEPPAVARRNQALLPPSAKPWLRMDSSPQARQTGRALRGLSGQRYRDQLSSGCWRSTGVAGAAGRRHPVEGAAAKLGAGRRTQVEQAAAPGATKRPEAGVAAAAEREARRDQEGELPRRPTGYRRTDKTCWWAGSTRRTACTRSCEKLPSSGCAALTCATKRREHTRFTASLRS